MSSPSFSEVNSSSDIKSLQRDHDVLFLLVHDEELDADWQVTSFSFTNNYKYYCNSEGVHSGLQRKSFDWLFYIYNKHQLTQ